jgi:uncharacterized protein YjbJ (UPF0337 family)
MDENRIEGAVKEGIGRVQDAYGGAAGDLRAQTRGKAKELVGSAQNLYGRAADQARDAVGQMGDQARDLVDTAKMKIGEQPYAAVGVAAVAGLLLGLAMGGAKATKVVYLRPAPD